MSEIVGRLEGPVMDAAKRFINEYFNNDGPRPIISIPARPESDTDLVLTRGLKDAVERIKRLEAACILARHEMNTPANGGAGWMAEFDRLAFPNEEATLESSNKAPE